MLMTEFYLTFKCHKLSTESEYQREMLMTRRRHETTKQSSMN